MFPNLKLISVLTFCFIYTSKCDPEAPFRFQRFRQQPQFFARQQAAPYAPAGAQPNVPFDLPNASNQPPSTQYGVPAPPPPPPPPAVEPLPSTSYGVPAPSNQFGSPAEAPSNQYGAPSQQLGTRDTELSSNESTENPDAEILSDVAPARLRSQKLRQHPSRQRPQFERLRAQAQQQHLQSQRLQELQQIQQLQQQQQGSYFIQLPNGSIQRVQYATQADPQDNSVSAQLKFRPVALAATESQILEPQPLFVNTFVTSYTVE